MSSFEPQEWNAYAFTIFYQLAKVFYMYMIYMIISALFFQLRSIENLNSSPRSAA